MYKNLTAESAEHEEVIFAMTRPQGDLIAFLCALSELRGEKKDPDNISIF
jgi:hypothetical protein